MRKAPANDLQAGAEMERKQATQMIFEMQEFAALSAAEQRFICRSLDVAAWGADATTLWSRSPIETASIKAQNKLYRTLLEVIRNSIRSEEHTSELQSLMRISYAVFCLKKKKYNTHRHIT